MIPLIDVSVNKKTKKILLASVAKIVNSNSYILGENLERFENNFANFIGVKYAIGVNSGTDALRLCLRSMGIGRGDKVLTVALTSPFTAIAIVEEGAIPIFCDIDNKIWTIDVNDAQKKIDHKTRAIIPVHLFGNPCNMQAILEFAKKYKLKIIEDACQAHGALYKRKFVGSFGDAAAFSFYPTKNLGGWGDGGIIVTNNTKVARLAEILRNGGQTRRFWHKYRGVNSRLDEIQAAILDTKLKRLEYYNHRRELLVIRYKKAFSGLPINFQEGFGGTKSANHLFVIRTKNRDALKDYLLKKGVFCDIYYPYPVHKQSAFRKYAKDSLPVTEKLTREILALPLYPRLSQDNQNKVITAVIKFFER